VGDPVLFNSESGGYMSLTGMMNFLLAKGGKVKMNLFLLFFLVAFLFVT